MFFYIAATSLFLALMCLTAWIFSHLSGTHFLIDSTDIIHLARVKILSVMGSFAVCFAALFIAHTIIVSSTPFFNERVMKYNGTVAVTAFFAGLLSPLLYFGAQGWLLSRWLPTLVCPHCDRVIDLIAPWPCAGSCRVTLRHVLARCRTCNTRMKGMVCDHCQRQIIFTDSYNEREVISRSKRHTTKWNPYFISAAIAIYVGGLGLYSSWQEGDTVWLSIWAVAASTAVITLIVQRPKTLVTNHHYKQSESVEEWLRRQR